MPLGPVDTVAAGIGRQNLRYEYRTTRALLAEQAEQIKASYRQQREQLRQDSEQALGTANAAANERGVLGSSEQIRGQQSVLSERDAALQDAFSQRTAGLLDIERQRQANAAQFRMGLAQLKLQEMAAEQQGSLDIYGGPTRKPGDYALDTSGANVNLDNVNRPSQVNRQQVRALANELSSATSVIQLTKMLNNLGFSSPQSHHDEAAYERDINVYKGKMYPKGEGQTSVVEQARLTLLARALRRAFGGPNGQLDELIYDPWGSYFGKGTRSKSPYGGHAAHLHFSFKNPVWSNRGSQGRSPGTPQQT